VCCLLERGSVGATDERDRERAECNVSNGVRQWERVTDESRKKKTFLGLAKDVRLNIFR